MYLGNIGDSDITVHCDTFVSIDFLLSNFDFFLMYDSLSLNFLGDIENNHFRL